MAEINQLNKGSPASNGTKLKSKVQKPAFKSSSRKRFQLFDPSVKNELVKICESGLLHLKLEKERGEEEDEDKSVSLDFEGDSSDEDINEQENLPIDKDIAKLLGLEETQKQIKAPANCGSCNVAFTDVAEQRLHYTLDWHRYNVKRKINGEECVSEAQFNEMIDDLSSIDGSDDEEDDTQVNRLMGRTPKDQSAKNTTEELVAQYLTSSQKLEKSPKIFFSSGNGQIISCYKTILTSEEDEQDVQPNVDDEVKKFEKLVKSPLKITIILLSGGHAAAATFEGNSCTNHKTFHSYTVRAKQGGGQGSRDAKSGGSQPKSAGASLRRYNEQSFAQHVHELLEGWKSDVSECNLIFYRAVSSNSNILFGGKTPPLSRDNVKLRTIPFPTKRPTFNEVKRVHSLLTTLHIYESMESFFAAHTHLIKAVKSKGSPSNSPSKVKQQKTLINRAKSRSPKRKDDVELTRNIEVSSSDNESGEICNVELEVDFSELKEFDDSLTPEQRKEGRKKKKTKKKPEVMKLDSFMEKLLESLKQKEVHIETFRSALANINEPNSDCSRINQAVDLQSSTLLHIAAQNNHIDCIWCLLEAGCDPAIKDKAGKYPYNYAESRETRDIFRKFMAQYPEKYDYKKAHIPPPLSEEEEKERAEKKKLLNKLKREKEKQKKAERKEKEKETEEQRRFLNLSDREKRALAAEQRILAQCKKNAEKPPVLVRCFECAVDITGKVPFEYNQNVFCTPKCLAAHRKKFPCPLSV